MRHIPIFSDLDEQERGEIQPYVVLERFEKREEIFSEGDPSEWFYIVLSGKVKITKLSHDGREIIIEVISPHDFFGGFAVLKGFPYPANAIAMEDAVVCKIARHHLLRIIDRFPSVMYGITANLGERIRDSHEMLKNIALERVEARIAALILKLADKAGVPTNNGEKAIAMRLTKQDIAEMVGTTVETSIRIMSRFRKSGFIDDDSGRIVVKEPKALQSIVDPSY
ncbi:MAG: Crp/Fnr family transcriptional regulator [Nitrospirota bacterium]